MNFWKCVLMILKRHLAFKMKIKLRKVELYLLVKYKDYPWWASKPILVGIFGVGFAGEKYLKIASKAITLVRNIVLKRVWKIIGTKSVCNISLLWNLHFVWLDFSVALWPTAFLRLIDSNLHSLNCFLSSHWVKNPQFLRKFTFWKITFFFTHFRLSFSTKFTFA